MDLFVAQNNPVSPFLRDDGSSTFLSHGDAEARVQVWAERFGSVAKELVFLYMPNTTEAVLAMLGAWRAGHALALLDPALDEPAQRNLEARYRPEWIVRPGPEEQLDLTRTAGSAGDIYPDNFLLLSTSGSTGSPKFVRLSRGNVESNARAIAAVLDIRSEEVGCAHLPLHYSYGASIVTSHLAAGAPILLTGKGFTDREFWPLLREAKVAHLPGVPFHFQMMARLGYARLNLPSLRVLTQAGGALPVQAREAAHRFMEEKGGRFHVMYGQTEAAPRLTSLPHADFPAAPASVGPPLPGGSFRILDDAGTAVAPGMEGHVWYTGPNVMLGYATERSDLAMGDIQGDDLETGDLGFLDDAGRLTLTGRAKRFAKIYGLRVNLDEVEALACTELTCAVVSQADLVVVVAETDSLTQREVSDRLTGLLGGRFTIPRTAYRFQVTTQLPRTDRGKVNYAALGVAP